MNESLRQAVIEQLGHDELNDECRETLQDVANHGAAGGFGQFVYYTDTCKFFQANKADIVALAEEQAEMYGSDMLEMIAGFNSLNGDYSQTEIGQVIFGNDGDTQIENIMAWFALETLAYELSE